jgi:peroxiredoxin
MKIGALLSIALLVPLAALAQKPPVAPTKPVPEPPRTKVQKPRPRATILGQLYVGQVAPDFELDDAHGHPTKLSSLHGDWVLLTFAERGREFLRLKGVQSRVRVFGTRVVGVSREKVGTLRGIARRDSLTCLLLADVTGQIAASYGLYDQETAQIEPGLILLDRGGRVRWLVAGPLPPPDALVRLVEYTVTGL